MSKHQSKLFIVGGAVALAAILAVSPMAVGTLLGSGNVTDIVQLSTSTSTLAALSSSPTGGSASGAPVTSGASAFTMTNSGSNVDTFVLYGWSATAPYYGASTGQTSISIRGTTHQISDLLWFQQQKLTAASVATTSEYFSPLLVKNTPASVATSTFTSSNNACTAWAGSDGTGFSSAAAGTFTFKYYPTTGQTNDAPLTSDTFHYCLDVTDLQVYLGESADFATATRLQVYDAESADSVLETYQYDPLTSTQVLGNKYCLVDLTGTGTSAAPVLAQCQKLAYEAAGSATIKLAVLHDPPAYFPSVNQAGGITYSVSGTQWNPYASTTTNDA